MFRLSLPPAALITVVILCCVLIVALVLTILPIVLFSIYVDRDSIAVRAPPFIHLHVRRDDVVFAMVLDLRYHPELKPTIRLYGIGLPSWRVGWYRLSNGSKAFIAINDLGQALVLKLKNDNYIILSPKDFDRFIETLKCLGWLP